MIRKFLLKQIKNQMNSTPIGKQVVETIWGKDHSLKASFGKANKILSPSNEPSTLKSGLLNFKLLTV